MLSSGEEPTASTISAGTFRISRKLTTGIQSGTSVSLLTTEAHGEDTLGAEGWDELRNELSA